MAIEHDGVDTIVNLAAGLDARPWRLRLPRELRWVDVDLPGIIEYKTSCLGGETPKCDYEAEAIDLREMWLWRFMSRFSSARRREEFRRFSGTVLLEAATPPHLGTSSDR